MIDIKEYMESIEQINKDYQWKMDELGMDLNQREHFLVTVKNTFDEIRPNLNEKHLYKSYERLLMHSLYQLWKVRRNTISKINKKLLKARGTVFWDSENQGVYRKEQNEGY